MTGPGAGETVKLATGSDTLEAITDVFADVIGYVIESVRVLLESIEPAMAALVRFLTGAEVDLDRLREAFDFHPRTLRGYLLDADWGDRRGLRRGCPMVSLIH